MNTEQLKIRLVGEIVVDVIKNQDASINMIRLGGIMHAARALWVLGVEYDIFYIAPDYLVRDIDSQAKHIGARRTLQIGTVNRSPNVLLVADPTEAGPQGYEMLLRDNYESSLDPEKLSTISADKSASDILIFAASYNLEEVLSSIGASDLSIQIDIGQGIGDAAMLSRLGRRFQTVMVSTSSMDFLERYAGSVHKLCDNILAQYCVYLLFKENRGGARLFSSDNPSTPQKVGAQVRAIVHSVGVGDCFDAVFIALRHTMPEIEALTYASWIAAEYASTYKLQVFKQASDRIRKINPKEITRIEGISLYWENRPTCNIYIAAPDFDYVDRSQIDFIAECLRYHNFIPRLPIRELGQAKNDDPEERRKELFSADLHLLAKCQILVAVLLNNDPGTLIEIGFAAGLRIPVIVYDPFQISNNLMLSYLPSLVTSNPDEIIARVYELFSREMHE